LIVGVEGGFEEEDCGDASGDVITSHVSQQPC
jgi:hypothetical protein